MAKSIEPNVIEYCGKLLRKNGITGYCLQQDTINSEIDTALADAPSKSGGSGGNRPDISFMFDNGYGRYIPVIIEAKGAKEKLLKTDDAGNPDMSKSAVKNYAVNGGIYYADIIVQNTSYHEAIAVGINGSELDADKEPADFELSAWYISEKNHRVPRPTAYIDASLKAFSGRNAKRLCDKLDRLNLTAEESEALKEAKENELEKRVNKIHDDIYKKSKFSLETNEKLYLFCGLILAGLPVYGEAPLTAGKLESNNSEKTNDGEKILTRVDSFLSNRNCSKEKQDMILALLRPVFTKKELWVPEHGQSALKPLFKEVYEEVIPCLTTGFNLDFMGIILNSIDDWVHIENDPGNDVVLTPRYITSFMAKLARTNMDSYVWDRAMGSGGFLVSAMEIMIRDAVDKIKDTEELDVKIEHIKTKQIFGIEILGNIYILSVLNMLLMGDGSSQMYYGDSHDHKDKKDPEYEKYWGFKDHANVFLLNPPYSAPGKGFNFVEETLKIMDKGYACVLIQENAGSGQGLPYTKKILEHNTLRASIHMPEKLFSGKSIVQTAIYVFEVARPHEPNDSVKFIDMSDDGYTRQNKKKSTQEINLRDSDDAQGRYAEVVDIILDKIPATDYYTEENGLYFKDTISLEGNDWTLSQHKKVDIVPSKEDFERTMSEYLAWRIRSEMREPDSTDSNSGPEEFRLNDCQLTKEDESILAGNEAPQLQKFKIGDLFDISSSAKKFNAFEIKFGGNYPYIARGGANNGIKGYITEPEEFLNDGNTISFGQDTKTMFYQKDPYFTGDKIKIMRLKDDELDERTAQYLITAMSKAFSLFAWGQTSFAVKVLNDIDIVLPADENGRPDYAFMRRYEQAVEKAVIQKQYKRYMREIGIAKRIADGTS